MLCKKCNSLFLYCAFCIALLIAPKISAQWYLNDTLHFNSDNTTILSMCFPTDTGIFVAGNKFMDSTGYDGYPLLGFVDTNGNSQEIYSDYDSDNFQMLGGSYYKLFLNTSGNFVLAYSNVKDTNEYPRIKEVTPQGQLFRDIRLDTIIDMGLFVKDFTRIYQHKDSSYWLWSISSFIENAPPTQQRAGPLLTILDKNFHVDTIIRYYFDPQKKWGYYFQDAVELDSGQWAVLISEVGPYGSDFIVENTHIRFCIIDKQGIIKQTTIISDSSQNGTAPTLIRNLEDDGYATIIGQGSWHGDTLFGYTYFANFDENFQERWRTLLYQVKLTVNDAVPFFGPKRVIATSDSNYLLLRTGDQMNGIPNRTVERICKISPTGEILWKRQFAYFVVPDTAGFDGNYHDMVDVRECPDGGFVFPGQISGYTFQVGWLVKTNCLGFLGPPEVGFAYKNNLTADSTYFYNTSVQAGSYFWDFGDGTTLNTDEYADTLVHQYADSGLYQITLIGYGCNGEADTLRYEVHVTPPPIKDSAITQVGEGYFTFFPNPVQTGNALHVYLNGAHEKTGKEINLSFYNSSGKIVQNTSISSKKGYYTLPNTLSSGVYFVHLTQNGNNIAVKKLVVM